MLSHQSENQVDHTEKYDENNYYLNLREHLTRKKHTTWCKIDDIPTWKDPPAAFLVKFPVFANDAPFFILLICGQLLDQKQIFLILDNGGKKNPFLTQKE